MRAITPDPEIQPRNLNLSQAAAYMGIGKNTARQLLEEIGATIRIGRRVLFSKKTIDHYFDMIAEGNEIAANQDASN